MKSIVEIYLIELSECKNCWYRDFVALIDEGNGQKHIFLTYENYDQLYGEYLYYQFYFN